MAKESFKEDGRPAQQWYWDDWFSSFDVRMCSVAARGLWIDMLGIMFKAEIRGTLTVNGRQVDNKTLAKIAGETEQIIDKLLLELEDNDVFSRLKDGTIISRRMYRESKKKEKISEIRAAAGKKGMEKRWGKGDNKGDNKKITKITASTSSSTPTPSSTSSSKDNIYPQKFEDFWNPYPRKIEKKDAFTAWKQLTNKQKDEVVIASGNYAIEMKRVGRELDKIKHPKTFLNKEKERWIDYMEKPKRRLQVGEDPERKESDKQKVFYEKRLKLKESLYKKYKPDFDKAMKDGEQDAIDELEDKIKTQLADFSQLYFKAKED